MYCLDDLISGRTNCGPFIFSLQGVEYKIPLKLVISMKGSKMDQPRNYRINGVELNWARLDTPVNPFGTEQWELQIATTDKAVADELSANHLNVKERDGKFVVALKRKAKKSDGSSMDPVRVVDAGLNAMENRKSIGNGSVGNVIVWQYPYEAMGRKGIASSLTAVQVTDLVEYTASAAADFEAIESEAPAGNPAELF